MSGHTIVTDSRARQPARWRAAPGWPAWMSVYQRAALGADWISGLLAGGVALVIRFGGVAQAPAEYLIFTVCLPVLWCVSVGLAHGYDGRFMGLGPDEFRRILNVGACITASVAVGSYLTRTEIARGYVVVALPCATAFDLVARFALRKRLHRRRRRGECMRRTVVVGHAAAVANLITELRREVHHGLSVVGACLAEGPAVTEIMGVPVCRGVGRVSRAVADLTADAVAVVACHELDGFQLRELAWELEKTGTDLFVAPALLDVAGPRTTIRPVAGLPLLHVDHPELAGGRRIVKSIFDRAGAAAALLLLGPLLAGIALAIRLDDGGPAIFRQTRIGKGERPFVLCKFRTMVMDAEERKAALAAQNGADGPLFKIRRDPRITRVGAWLRRWSLDELPQLWNVFAGDMSLVGPRPPLPDEAAQYGHHMRRRLAVKPGITGLWQVSGRADLPWDEAVRLDVRYVENWSLMLDLQILWKTVGAVARGSGAY